jgi:hypothetical protein
VTQSRVDEQVWYQVRRQVKIQLGDMVWSQVTPSIWTQAGNQIWNQVALKFIMDQVTESIQ